MSADSTMDLADCLLAEGRARRHRERTELVKMITSEAAEQETLLAKCAKFDAQILEVQKTLLENEKLIAVLEKQASSDAVQPKPPELGSWSPQKLAAVIAGMSPAEIAKLRQS